MENGHNNKIKMLALIVAFFGYGVTHARVLDVNNDNGNKGNGSNPTPTAGCSSASSLAFLDFNNVRARLENTGGSMFQDRPNGAADYNIPKQKTESDPRFTAIYSGSLWIAGIDAGNQLKVAAVTYRQSGQNDFWPGPLDNTPDVTADVCSVFDQFFGVSKRMVKEFVAWHNDPASYPNYQIPAAILNYPGKGRTITKKTQSYYVADHLAPFFDADGDDFYDPNKGDYPFYDLAGDIDCRTSRFVPLFGDTTLWFVFNDMGNTHTESNSVLPIGMEIRGQAFAFATNDEVNDMTFYNYELVNRSSFTFQNTYFGQWVDTDLGFSDDDYAGCDATRGLGYCYNGDNNDEGGNGVAGYGTTPPFIGVDFFEGPYMDNDGMDNPLTTDVPTALAENGIPYSGLGIGYGDSIIDNERYGMRKFVYFNRDPKFTGDGDPSVASDFYNYLRGNWKDGSTMKWGGNGHFDHPASSGIDADLLFPGTSDPLNWSTADSLKGAAPTPLDWSEKEVNNPVGDRRFLESAGPFTLSPGAVNALTVGIVYARATSGDNVASLTYLQVADDKAQSLFDNCFKILDGPSAPDMVIQELENELVLYLSNNNKISNNYHEGYHKKDPFIAIPDYGFPTASDTLTDAQKDEFKYYDFQGYQIYQVKNSNVSVSQLEDPSLSRLIAQVDLEDKVANLVNYTYFPDINSNAPKVMVTAENKGIRHSFRVQNDEFATGSNKKLVNHKTYHFMAIAYGYNNWKAVNPQNFTLGGQLTTYIGSRNSSVGGNIVPVSAIPHNPKPEDGGTILHSSYGDSPQITRIEGAGNGGLVLELTSASEAQIVSSSFMDYPVYEAGAGPIDVKVVDPLNVKMGTYIVQVLDSTPATGTENPLDDAYWRVTKDGVEYFSERTISTSNEQIFTDLGFSITIRQTEKTNTDMEGTNGVISSSITYTDPTKQWLSGAADVDARADRNWILSGMQTYDETGPPVITKRYNDYNFEITTSTDTLKTFIDPNENFENILGGTWAPYRYLLSAVNGGQTYPMTSAPSGRDFDEVEHAPSIIVGWLQGASTYKYASTYFTNKFADNLPSVDIVFTSDKSKWSKCVVFETGNDLSLNIGGALYFQKRQTLNIDKNGNPDGSSDPLGNPGMGMGWFPGYAINVETGERLNIAFGENSSDAANNGTDLLWNPTSTLVDFSNFPILDTVVAGRHYTYVFNTRYDAGYHLDSLLSFPRVFAERAKSIKLAVNLIASTAVWAGIPSVAQGSTLLASDARIKLRVQAPYMSFLTANSANPAPTGNSQRPMYMFNMDGFAAEHGNADAAKEVLDIINVVPNPYYAYSEYENTKLDTRIKVTNLPENCTISIYNVNGTLMRRYVKADPKTSLDWDMKNQVGIPVAGGVYLIHVEVPDVGEVVLKWFGVTRPTDLNGF